jgi:hypothetical protein
VAVAGSINKIMKPNIPNWRPMKLNREKAYAAVAPNDTANRLVPKATNKLFANNLLNVIHVLGSVGFVHNKPNGSINN